jgi:hypothetical protein
MVKPLARINATPVNWCGCLVAETMLLLSVNDVALFRRQGNDPNPNCGCATRAGFHQKRSWGMTPPKRISRQAYAG